MYRKREESYDRIHAESDHDRGSFSAGGYRSGKSGHIGTPRDGILQVKAKNNSQGLVDLGIHAGAEALEGVKALVSLR